MRRNLLIKFCLLAAIITAATLSGCGRGKQQKAEALELDSIGESDEVSMHPGADTPSITITVNYIYPSKDKDLLRCFNTLFFGDTVYADLPPEAAVREYIKRRGQLYRDEYTDTKTEGLNADLFNKNVDISDSILYSDSLVVALQVETYVEDGSAQPGTEVRYYNILRTNCQVLLESDIFVDGSKPAVTKLIVGRLMREFNVNRPDELENEGFFNLEDLQPGDNFYVDKTGITFRFDRLDMVASEDGSSTAVHLPYDAVAEYIKAESPLRKYIP